MTLGFGSLYERQVLLSSILPAGRALCGSRHGAKRRRERRAGEFQAKYPEAPAGDLDGQ